MKTIRTSGNHRRIPLEEIEKIIGKQKIDAQITLCYCRCSTKKQEENLERQVGRVLEHCAKQGWQTELYKDIGSGLNEKRINFKKLLKRITEEDVARVVIEYEDRISRYGFETFKTFCNSFGTEVVVLQNKINKSFEEELVDDVIAVLTSCSARLYGKRGKKTA